MTTEDQHIAIAQIHLKLKEEEIHSVTGRGLVYAIRTERGMEERRVPNYTGDLNAIHATIKAQPENTQWLTFAMLADIVDAKIPAYLGTAAQWAEAFLRAAGKWK